MGNKYPKIKLDLQPWEQQKLQKLKRLKKFTSLPETFHYLLHSKTVLGNSKDIREVLKECFTDHRECNNFLQDTSETAERALLLLQISWNKNGKTETRKRTTYDIFPSDRILVDNIKKYVKSRYQKSVSDTVVFKTLLSRLHIPNELSNEECVQYLETFKQKLNDVSSFYWELKERFFIHDITEKYRKELEEVLKKSFSSMETISIIDLYIDMAVEQIDYALELISKK